MEKGNTSQKKMKPSKKKKTKRFYCILCRSYYVKCAAQEHVHGMLHHRELETVLGKDLCHDCHACWISVVGLNEYAQHISTAQHKANLQTLVSGRVKTFSLCQTLSAEAMTKIQERNKTIKKEVKKAMKKQKKKLKQKAGRKQTTRETTEKSKQVNLNAPMQDTYQREGSVALVKNKENKDFSLQRQLHETEFLQNQSGFYHFSGGSSGRTWHQPYVQEQFTQSSPHTKYDDNLSVNNQSIGIKTKHSQRNRLNKSYAMPRDTTLPPFRKYNYYNTESSSAGDKDFTSDHLPQNGAIVFDRGQNASSGCSQAEREGSHCSANPALANRPDTTAPIRDVDVGVTLRQIRRALGVREPSKADREAKRPNKVAGTDKGPSSGASGASVQYPQDNYPSSSAHSSIAPTKTKQTTVRTTEERSQHCQKSLAVANGLARSRETQGPLDWPVAVRQHMCEATPPELNLNKSQRVRIAHKPGRAQESTHKPTLNKLYSLSGATSKLSWSEMYEGMKRRKHNSVKSTRFGTEPSNPPNTQETSTQQDTYMPLSEGFHWESFPDIPSNSHPTLPPPLQDPPNLGSRREEHSTSPPHEPLEQPKTAEQDGTGCKVTAASVKVEPNFEIDNKGSNKDCSASKRKHKAVTDDDISDKEPSGKRKKTKSKKGYHQMDQLLAVSLREEELSHSLQDLDKSLVQARNSLQAAYADVQRLLLLRQQFISEVNSLRVKRIEILQGMQEGYSGTYNVGEKASTYSAQASFQPALCPLPSTAAKQPPPSPTLTSLSITQPHPHFVNGVLSNTDAPPAQFNQPMSLFPSDLLTPLLLRPSHSAAASLDALPSIECDSEEATGGNGDKEEVKLKDAPKKAPVAGPDSKDGNESDDSVKMMEPSNLVVIDIDELDNETSHERVSNVPAKPEPPQTSVIAEFSSASTQTAQQIEPERKVQQSVMAVKDSSITAESVEEEKVSLGAFGNHTGPVHGLQIHDGLMYTCSGDNTARAYSLTTKECQTVFEGHTNKVNCLLVSSLPNMPTCLYTGSSDQTIRCYSIKSKKCLEQLALTDRVLCLHIAWSVLYVGLANGSVVSFDLKTRKQLDVFECHGPRGVSCLAAAQEGARRVLLVGSYDTTISVRDAKSGLLLRSLEGHTKTVLCMKVVNDLVFSGSSDTSVRAHNIHTGELVRIYKGHGHAVTSIVILGKVMVTACLDKLVRVYELQSHDRLQVYGGHSDMVMCMAIHKSVIYTGCYDGSVCAVKLNLMKNYRCWWQNCTLIFGIVEHLVQHLVRDHSNPNLQTVRCRWKGCNRFFATQQSVRQELPDHMQSHVESDSQVQL